MSALLAALGLMASGALLQVQLLPWTPDKSACFTADANLDGRAEICILQEQRLHIYGRRGTTPLHSVSLPPRTTAIDIVDIGHDKVADLIALCEERVLRYTLSGGTAGEPETLFSQPSQFSRADGYPFPTVLIVEREGVQLIALPTEESLEVHSLDGKLVNSYPIGVNAPYHVSIGKPFSYWVNQHAQSGPADALEFRVNSLASYKPLMPDGAFPIDVSTPATQRLGLGRQQWDADAHNPDSWPWFSIARSEDGTIRALYRQSNSDPDTTVIRVRTLSISQGDATAGGDVVGPPRNYPGTLILQQDALPDFNGDGFTDLVLWKSPRPTLSADALARAATSKTWPLNITTHLYLADKKRFAPKPGTLINLQVPVTWLLSASSQGPLPAVVLRDFNGDGKTDFASLTSEDVMSVWQGRETGLDPEPVFQEQFPARVDEVMFESDLDGQGTTSIAVRCGNQLAVLRPNPTLPAGG